MTAKLNTKNTSETPSSGSAMLLNWNRWNLFPKLAVAISAILIVATVMVTVITLQREQISYQEELVQQSLLTLDALVALSQDDLYLLNVDGLSNAGTLITNSDLIQTVRFFDPDGRLISSTGDVPFELNFEPDPLGQQLMAQDDTSLEREADKLVVGRAVIVGNEVIGAVNIDVSTVALQSKLAAVTRSGVLTGLTVIMIGIVLTLVISRPMVSPLQELAAVTQLIAEGNLDTTVPKLRTSQEVETLRNALETMRQSLRDVYVDLEKQVASRTAELNQTNQALSKINEELQAANEQAAESNRIKSEFLATMSHELRTPLNAVNGYCGLMLMGVTGNIDDEARETIASIQESSDHLLALINDVLDISKIEASRMTLIENPITLRSLVGGWERRIRVLANNKGLEFETFVSSDLPDEIYGDEERLTQIANNLLANAVKFTDSGKVSLTLDKHQDNMWTLEVKDTGVGVPPEAQNYIFDAFRQIDGSYNRAHGGTGLGLAIVSKLVHAMGGTIRLDSVLGKGSTFTVTLPLKVVETTVLVQ